MTKELRPFYIDADTISDDNVREICKVVVSLGGKVHEDETGRGSWDLFGVDGALDTVWYDYTSSYGNATRIKSMEEFREMFCEEEPNIVAPLLSFTDTIKRYADLYDQMPTEDDKQYIAQKMEELCRKYTGDVGWMQLDMSNIKQINEEAD